jgi:hypothetical protein
MLRLISRFTLLFTSVIVITQTNHWNFLHGHPFVSRVILPSSWLQFGVVVQVTLVSLHEVNIGFRISFVTWVVSLSPHVSFHYLSCNGWSLISKQICDLGMGDEILDCNLWCYYWYNTKVLGQEGKYLNRAKVLNARSTKVLLHSLYTICPWLD